MSSSTLRESTSPMQNITTTQIRQWVFEISKYQTRANALFELSTRREYIDDLGILVWNSTAAVVWMVVEILNTRRQMSPEKLTTTQAERTCHVLGLFQCVAAHPKTYRPFMSSKIIKFLIPFLCTVSSEKQYEELRLETLKVICTLFKDEDREIIKYLLKINIISSCSHAIEFGSDYSKIFSTYIIFKILYDDYGLEFMCETHEKFCIVATILWNLIYYLKEHPNSRLLKCTLHCYLRMCVNEKAREALRTVLPDYVRDDTFGTFYILDANIGEVHANLLKKLDTKAEMS